MSKRVDIRLGLGLDSVDKSVPFQTYKTNIILYQYYEALTQGYTGKKNLLKTQNFLQECLEWVPKHYGGRAGGTTS